MSSSILASSHDIIVWLLKETKNGFIWFQFQSYGILKQFSNNMLYSHVLYTNENPN